MQVVNAYEPPPPVLSYTEEVLLDSPALYYRMRETADGTLTAEAGPNGTITNIVAYEQPGPDPQALAAQWNGTSSVASIPAGVEALIGSPGAIAATGGWVTVELWVQTTKAIEGFVVYDSGSGANRPFVVLGYAGVVEAYVNNQLGPVFDGTVPIDDGVWHHVVVAMQGGTNLGASDGVVRVYVDGVLDSEFTTGSQWPASAGLDSLRIGALHDLTGKFEGLMTEVAVYAHELTATRVADHYAAMFPTP